MNQFFRSLPGHFATAWKSIIRHVSLTFSSATAVTVTLLIVGLLVLIAGNINSFTNNIEQDFQIQATISPGVGEEEQREALRTQIEAEENVSLLGVVILVACLVFLFCLIWFVVNKILLLEIEAQVFGPAQEKVSQALVRQYVPRAVKRFT